MSHPKTHMTQQRFWQYSNKLNICYMNQIMKFKIIPNCNEWRRKNFWVVLFVRGFCNLNCIHCKNKCISEILGHLSWYGTIWYKQKFRKSFVHIVGLQIDEFANNVSISYIIIFYYIIPADQEIRWEWNVSIQFVKCIVLTSTFYQVNHAKLYILWSE